MLKHRAFTESELKENKKIGNQLSQKKFLNDGKIYLSIRNSGHVKISYHKTFIQYLGFMIEWISWILIFFIFKQKYSKIRSNSHLKKQKTSAFFAIMIGKSI